MRIILAALIGLVAATSAQASITTTNVNCRATAAVRSAVVERLPAGTSVSVLRRSGNRVQVDRRRDCWIASSYIAGNEAVPVARSYKPTSASRRSTVRETRRANRRSLLTSYHRPGRAARPRRRAQSYFDGGGSCPCSGSNICIGPRGGRYCITSGGNKRYGL